MPMSNPCDAPECKPNFPNNPIVVVVVQVRSWRPFSSSILSYNYYLLLVLLAAFGDIGGNSLQPCFIFFANTRYASSASICVSYVLLRSIHILRYLSEPRSFSAAYHSPEDVCFRLTARRRPPSPVTPLACLRQAALSPEIVVWSSGGSSAKEPMPIPRSGGEVFERVSFGFGGAGAAIFGEVLGDEERFEDEDLEDEDFDEDAFGDDALADEDLEDFSLGSLEEGIFEDGVFGAVAFQDGTDDVLGLVGVDGVFGAFEIEAF